MANFCTASPPLRSSRTSSYPIVSWRCASIRFLEAQLFHDLHHVSWVRFPSEGPCILLKHHQLLLLIFHGPSDCNLDLEDALHCSDVFRHLMIWSCTKEVISVDHQSHFPSLVPKCTWVGTAPLEAQFSSARASTWFSQFLCASFCAVQTCIQLGTTRMVAFHQVLLRNHHRGWSSTWCVKIRSAHVYVSHAGRPVLLGRAQRQEQPDGIQRWCHRCVGLRSSCCGIPSPQGGS